MKGKRYKHPYHASSITVIADAVNADALHAWTASKSYRIDELHVLPTWGARIEEALKQAAQNVLSHLPSECRDCRCRDYQRATETLRTLQAAAEARHRVPTHLRPLQLGYCTTEQWVQSLNICRITLQGPRHTDCRASLAARLAVACGWAYGNRASEAT